MNYPQAIVALGHGSAHPGGFAATLAQLKRYPIPPGSDVLEVGCGTGRTACHLAKQGARVTAVDINPIMLRKASWRAAQEGVAVELVRGDACALPFPDDRFDVVLVESVSVFVDTPAALREYYRVLKPGGKLYDRENIATAPLTADAAAAVRAFFGVERLLTPLEWDSLLRRAGFKGVSIWGPFRYPVRLDAAGSEREPPDPLQAVDPWLVRSPQFAAVAAKYNEIMSAYGGQFGYAVFSGTKPPFGQYRAGPPSAATIKSQRARGAKRAAAWTRRDIFRP